MSRIEHCFASSESRTPCDVAVAIFASHQSVSMALVLSSLRGRGNEGVKTRTKSISIFFFFFFITLFFLFIILLHFFLCKLGLEIILQVNYGLGLYMLWPYSKRQTFDWGWNGEESKITEERAYDGGTRVEFPVTWLCPTFLLHEWPSPLTIAVIKWASSVNYGKPKKKNELDWTRSLRSGFI